MLQDSVRKTGSNRKIYFYFSNNILYKKTKKKSYR